MDQVQLATELKGATTERSTLEVLRKCVLSHYRQEWLRYFDSVDSTQHFVGKDEMVDSTTRALQALRFSRAEPEERRAMEDEDRQQTCNVKGAEFVIATQGAILIDNKCTRELKEWVSAANEFLMKHEVSNELQEIYRKALQVVVREEKQENSDESDKE